jgi:8-oxo-dGTP pyrophosphatase MutT (NUDIX family)
MDMHSLRLVARVLLLDEHDKILLIEGGDPTQPDSQNWWFTPGGGVEEDESLHEACARELWEETGLTLMITGDPIWQRDASFSFMGTDYHQREYFFVARTKNFVPQSTSLTEIEKASMYGFRWWTQGELSNSNEVIYPIELKSAFNEVLNPPSETRLLTPEIY